MTTTPSWYTATPSPIHPTDVSSVSLGTTGAAMITQIIQSFALGLTGVTSYSPTIFAPLVQVPVLIKLAVGLLLMIDPLISLSLLF